MWMTTPVPWQAVLVGVILSFLYDSQVAIVIFDS